MFERELEIAERAARAAGVAAMQYYGTTDAQAKADRSPVTAADHASNDVILAALHDAFPSDVILSEESTDSRERLLARRVWIVDPLDGTREFLAANGEFSVMIGLVLDGAAVLGVVHLPATGVTYLAATGGGAWAATDGTRTRLQCRPADLSALRLVGSRSHPDPLVEQLRTELGIHDVEPCGSVGVKCARIAEGRRDLYVHPVPYLKEWDTCAPEVVLREAGGWVSDCRGDALRYNKADPAQPFGIVACTPDVVAMVLPPLRRLGRFPAHAATR